MARRAASHAGSWYSSSNSTLSSQLDEWLDQVPDSIDDAGKLPPSGARMIIAPHAGYSYSGPAAAWAYKSLDLTNAKRIFLLGPSHHIYLSGCALSACDSYETPLGDLKLDKKTISELHTTKKFDTMSLQTDENEHSLEMHLPYIYKVLSRAFSNDPTSFPDLIPILVGATSAVLERTYGALLLPYLRDPTSVFIVSSDFCHWGLRFNYTYYLPVSLYSAAPRHLRAKDAPPSSPPIHESIARLDKMAMDAIEAGRHEGFLEVLKETGNTVCGRHPIGVMMAGLDKWEAEEGGKAGGKKGRFKFVRYERSSDVTKVNESSVSYASAFAQL
ncbi:hypothetical protein FGG08_006222 [Glutinoglossum americanum]|uniref:Uncharacterized protein n=1 Tax=Glutinoglossum americanum TaxID=1670608 RepID=A0A9P8I1Q2_9PEZI|nr:hypothetical protein FGG08_006222 [Glutinoglossum americanum]